MNRNEQKGDGDERKKKKILDDHDTIGEEYGIPPRCRSNTAMIVVENANNPVWSWHGEFNGGLEWGCVKLLGGGGGGWRVGLSRAGSKLDWHEGVVSSGRKNARGRSTAEGNQTGL
jgi:hypothetical protein